MIVRLGDRTPEDAIRLLERTVAALGKRHFSVLDAGRPRKFAVTRAQAAVERERMQVKVYGTEELAGRLREALAAMRRDALHSLGLREALSDRTKTKAFAADFKANFDARHFTKAFAPTVRRMVVSGFESARTELMSQQAREAAPPPKKKTATVSVGFGVYPQGAIDALYLSELEFADDIVDREKVALKSVLMDGVANGDSGATIAKTIKAFFAEGMHYVDDRGEIVRTVPDDSWIQTVARTEVAKANNAGVLDFYKQAGVDMVTFMAASDCCDECAEEDGQSFPVDDDDDLPPIHPNCRCTVISTENYNEFEGAP